MSEKKKNEQLHDMNYRSLDGRLAYKSRYPHCKRQSSVHILHLGRNSRPETNCNSWFTLLSKLMSSIRKFFKEVSPYIKLIFHLFHKSDVLFKCVLNLTAAKQKTPLSN